MQKVQKFNQLLIEEFERRKLRNSSYSLRAFAKSLHLAPSTLSELMSLKRIVSLKQAEKILKYIDISPEKLSDVFSKSEKEDNIQRVLIDTNKYFLVADPIYYSLLCLLEIPSTKHSIEYLAERLNTKTMEVSKAIQRLEQLEVLEKKASKWKIKKTNFTTDPKVVHSSLRSRHIRNLEDARHAIEQIEPELRDCSFMTMAVDTSKIPEARDLITKFRRDMAKLLESGKQEEVYELSIQLFPRSNLQNIKKK